MPEIRWEDEMERVEEELNKIDDLAMEQEELTTESRLTNLASKLLELRAEEFKRKGELKAIGEQYDATVAEINEILTSMESTKFDHQGKLFYQHPNNYPKIKPDKFDAFIAYLKEKGQDGIAKLGIHRSTLKEWFDMQSEDEYETLTNYLDIPQGENDIYVKGDHEKAQVAAAYETFKQRIGK